MGQTRELPLQVLADVRDDTLFKAVGQRGTVADLYKSLEGLITAVSITSFGFAGKMFELKSMVSSQTRMLWAKLLACWADLERVGTESNTPRPVHLYIFKFSNPNPSAVATRILEEVSSFIAMRMGDLSFSRHYTPATFCNDILNVIFGDGLFEQR